MKKSVLLAVAFAMANFARAETRLKIPIGECTSIEKTVHDVCLKTPQSEATRRYWSFVLSNYSLIENKYATGGYSCNELSKSVASECDKGCSNAICIWNLALRSKIPAKGFAPESQLERLPTNTAAEWEEGTGSTNMPSAPSSKDKSSLLSDIDAVKESEPESADLTERASAPKKEKEAVPEESEADEEFLSE